MPLIRLSYENQALDVTPAEVTWPQLWVVSGVADELAAIRYAFWNVPESLGPAKLAKLRVGSRLGTNTWTVEASYSTKRKEAINKDATEEGGYNPVADGIVVEYGLGIETRNIKTARGTTIYHADGSYTDVQRLIGVDKDGVQGADIGYGLVSFSVTKQFQLQDITEELRAKWEEFADPQHVNDDEFGPYAAGEVLFNGIQNCRLEGSPTNLIPVTFSFSRRRNQTDVEFGPDITIPSIKGWQMVDQRYEEAEDNVNHQMIRKVKSVAIHDVFPEGDFDALECGL